MKTANLTGKHGKKTYFLHLISCHQLLSSANQDMEKTLSLHPLLLPWLLWAGASDAASLKLNSSLF